LFGSKPNAGELGRADTRDLRQLGKAIERVDVALDETGKAGDGEAEADAGERTAHRIEGTADLGACRSSGGRYLVQLGLELRRITGNANLEFGGRAWHVLS
jgi:hypothetical protein